VKKKLESVNDLAAQLIALTRGQVVYLPNEVPPGYMSVKAVSMATPGITTRTMNNRLLQLHQQGKVDRIAVAESGRWAYWYRVK